ncbi:DUF1203 domain-containing protein [Kitasatospora sp. MBT63]|uniref:DUF1203 domain-containing protein n=1 Tax=Kitasatospora sp. MBT63 TaxID=1444768 RepID=UPI00053A121E|nr:DUF1203 domain-containing protein [Kitasatospora sp. MBT63]
MTTPESTLDVRPVAPEVLRTLRTVDDAGRPPVRSTDTSGGSPLRCCLTLARPGEDVLLLSYAPLRRWAAEAGADPGPYDETGPVFVHAGECPGPAGGWPRDLHQGERVVRCYDADGRILRGRAAGPAEVRQVVAEELADPDVAVVHVRALAFGCFLHEVRRGPAV